MPNVPNKGLPGEERVLNAFFTYLCKLDSEVCSRGSVVRGEKGDKHSMTFLEIWGHANLVSLFLVLWLKFWTIFMDF